MLPKPVLSKGTQNMTKNLDIKNVFDRQQIFMKAKEALDRQNLSIERYKRMNGITDNPQINQKSQSLQRTVDDLYTWEQRKNNKLSAERNKSTSPSIGTYSSSFRSNTGYDALPVEDRLITQGLKTQKKLDLKVKEKQEEILQQSSPKMSYTYPSKAKYIALHNHYVETEQSADGRNELLDPIKQSLEMSEGKKWSELTLLERNQLFINNKEAKIKRERKDKRRQEVAECSFEPKLSNFNPKKLEITPLIDQDPEAEAKMSSSLERIMKQVNKNKNYSQIHSERLRQRSLEKE